MGIAVLKMGPWVQPQSAEILLEMQIFRLPLDQKLSGEAAICVLPSPPGGSVAYSRVRTSVIRPRGW